MMYEWVRVQYVICMRREDGERWVDGRGGGGDGFSAGIHHVMRKFCPAYPNTTEPCHRNPSKAKTNGCSDQPLLGPGQGLLGHIGRTGAALGTEHLRLNHDSPRPSHEHNTARPRPARQLRRELQDLP